ncbi:hypothetical protein [Lacinutrix venerupis]|uniref:Uncharacterized protein n=1 Tax=Lacinutrix venerupis TaxID=1486034 RepID=A0AAC9LLN1_9FLAO|nr:hypothetical protein [Lacinutrix venerupis]APY00750.1 hypothetical protein BWR22_10635 [Lacinutrix venerupis]
MAKDIRDMFKADNTLQNDSMPNGHEARFLSKLETAMPEKKTKKINWLSIAASVIVLLGLSFGAIQFFNSQNPKNTTVVEVDPIETKTIGDISPDLKKVEDYYLANINLELSKVKLTPENKDLFDGYIKRLDELKAEYNRLNVELTKQGPDELTVDALISNLKLRLNLMHRLKEQLKDLNSVNENQI